MREAILTEQEIYKQYGITDADLKRYEKYRAEKKEEAAKAQAAEDRMKWLRRFVAIDFDASGITWEAIAGKKINISDRVRIQITPEGKKALGLLGLGIAGLIWFLKKK